MWERMLLECIKHFSCILMPNRACKMLASSHPERPFGCSRSCARQSEGDGKWNGSYTALAQRSCKFRHISGGERARGRMTAHISSNAAGEWGLCVCVQVGVCVPVSNFGTWERARVAPGRFYDSPLPQPNSIFTRRAHLTFQQSRWLLCLAR